MKELKKDVVRREIVDWWWGEERKGEEKKKERLRGDFGKLIMEYSNIII